jgi:NAD(P)-dependent dehydrogenase (short-subunit alcohol dehydrogenase family)
LAVLLTDKVALITGGAKGIGKGIAVKFASEGCAIAIADIDMKSADQTVAEETKKGHKIMALKCDVTNTDQVNAAVKSVIEKFGKIDILVNNAGALPKEYPTIEMPESEWDKVINLNLKSDFLFCKAVMPYMVKQKYGKVVNLSSSGAYFPPGPSVHYSAAKAGVIGLTIALAQEFAPYNITVNAIMPGPIKTDFWNPLVGEANKDAVCEMIGKNEVPLGRVGTPNDIAGAALFLASELSSFVTGVSMLVSGGMPLKAFPPK